jgi:hypothetical protein
MFYRRSMVDNYCGTQFARPINIDMAIKIDNTHNYHTNEPTNDLLSYIPTYVEPSDWVLDTVCAEGMTGDLEIMSSRPTQRMAHVRQT